MMNSRSGMWFFRDVLASEPAFFGFGGSRRLGREVHLQLGRFLPSSTTRAVACIRMGMEKVSGHKLGSGAGHCFPVGCPAVVETWAGREGNPSLSFSQVAEILPGCADMVTRLLPPLFSSVSPGPGREVRNGLGWSLMEKTARSGVWLFRGALSGSSAFFAFAAFASWVEKGSFLTAWAVPPLSSCSCSYLYGRGTAVGPQSGERCWPLLDRLWSAIAPVVKPWCAEGEVPTAANVDFYRGVSIGTAALFKWKANSCSDRASGWCWHHHDDLWRCRELGRSMMIGFNQCVAVPDATRLDDALGREGVSSAWVVWSCAAESALAEAFCFVGGRVLDGGLVLGRGAARFRVVRLVRGLSGLGLLRLH